MKLYPGRIGIRIAPNIFRVGLTLLAIFLWWGTSAPVQAAFGELRVLRGEVVVVRGRIEILVIRRITLEDGDRIETRPGSKAHIRLSGLLSGGEAIVTENTRIRVNELKPRRRVSPFRLLFGAIRSRILKYTSASPFMVTTTATIGIKGTDFIAYVKRKTASEFIGVAGLIEAGSRSLPQFAIRIGKRQWGEIVEGEKPRPPIRVPDALWESALREFSFPQ